MQGRGKIVQRRTVTSVRAAPSKRRVLAFVSSFLGAVTLLAVVRAAGVERPAAEAVGRWTVAAVYGVLKPVQPDLSAVGNVLATPNGALLVAEECSGFDLIGLLSAAMIAYPMVRRRRLLAVALVAPFVFALNGLRVATLSLVLAHSPDVFDTVHVFVWQGVLILVALLYWTTWVGLEAELT